jgi:hypothetical protein
VIHDVECVLWRRGGAAGEGVALVCCELRRRAHFAMASKSSGDGGGISELRRAISAVWQRLGSGKVKEEERGSRSFYSRSGLGRGLGY